MTDARALAVLAVLALAGVSVGVRADDAAVVASTSEVGAIVGRVQDRATREPLAGVTVVATLDGGSAIAQATISEADGRYRLAALPPGLYVLTLYLDSWAMERRNIVVTAGRDATVVLVADYQMAPVAADVCVGPASCPAWQVCSTAFGDCGDAWAPYEICTGVCTTGTFHLAARVSGVLGTTDAGFDGTAAFGLELLPPFVGHRLSIAADRWTEGAWRLGGALWLHPEEGLAVSARVDAFGSAGAWDPAIAVRVDARPWWRFVSGDWRSHTTLSLEVGLLLADDARTFVTVGVAGWLGWPGLF